LGQRTSGKKRLCVFEFWGVAWIDDSGRWPPCKVSNAQEKQAMKMDLDP